MGVETKHKHVYEFLRNAIKKFDPTLEKKIPEIQNENVNSSVNDDYIHTSAQKLS